MGEEAIKYQKKGQEISSRMFSRPFQVPPPYSPLEHQLQESIVDDGNGFFVPRVQAPIRVSEPHSLV